MAVCLKCGFDLAGNESECPRCGVILGKARPPRVQPIVPEAPAITSPAPHAGAATVLKGNATKVRLFAAAIDNFVAILVCLLIATQFKLADSVAGRSAFASLAYLAYFFVQEGSCGTTLGKRVFGLRVARLDGGPAGWTEAWWRTVLRLLEVNPLFLGAIPGGLVIAWSKRRQRLGDMVAGTVVVSRNTLALASEQAEVETARGE